MTKIDEKKLLTMWEKIILYEQTNGKTDTARTSVNRIEEIIRDVSQQCY